MLFDANEKMQSRAKSFRSALTVGLAAIPAADAPNGNELAINCGKIEAVAGTTYVFEFVNDDAVDAEYGLTSDATFVDGTVYYTKSGDVYTPATVTPGETVTADTYYVITTPAKPATKSYKVIKVKN